MRSVSRRAMGGTIAEVARQWSLYALNSRYKDSSAPSILYISGMPKTQVVILRLGDFAGCVTSSTFHPSSLLLGLTSSTVFARMRARAVLLHDRFLLLQPWHLLLEREEENLRIPLLVSLAVDGDIYLVLVTSFATSSLIGLRGLVCAIARLETQYIYEQITYKTMENYRMQAILAYSTLFVKSIVFEEKNSTCWNTELSTTPN